MRLIVTHLMLRCAYIYVHFKIIFKYQCDVNTKKILNAFSKIKPLIFGVDFKALS